MAEGETGARPGNRRGRRRGAIAAGITCAAIAAAIVHVVKPGLSIDGTTAVLIAVAIVPWLGDLFDSIELPGVAKFQYKQLVDRIEAAEERTTQAGRSADDASRTARIALVTTGGADVEASPDVSADRTVEELADAYTLIREKESSGPPRTYRMERIFADMVTASQRVAEFDVEPKLRSGDPGTRLTAYARLYARPDGNHLDALAEAVLADRDTAFNQYWGFHAIGAVVDEVGPGKMRLEHVEGLWACLPLLPIDSDRIDVLGRLLAKLTIRRTPTGAERSPSGA